MDERQIGEEVEEEAISTKAQDWEENGLDKGLRTAAIQLTMGTGSAGIAIAKQCGHMILHLAMEIVVKS